MRYGFRAIKTILALVMATWWITTATAQIIVNPNRMRSVVSQLENDHPAEQTLRCEVSPTKPALNFGFRYQAGYVVTVPMSQYNGAGHGWYTMMRITPEGGAQRPVYLVSQIALPPVPKTNVESRVGGGYLLGEGAYNVLWMMLDDAGRVCRTHWHVNVHTSRADRQVKVAMPPDTVWEIGLRGPRGSTMGRSQSGTSSQPTSSQPPSSEGTDDARPLRMTIFLHTAPLFPRRTRMRPNDMVTLMTTVSSLLERVPASSVRLVLFNLEQQKELYRKDGFLLRELPQVSQAMANIELGLVDFQVLQNKKGHVDLLTDLVNREIAEEQPSDVVLFLGPTSRFSDHLPTGSLQKTAGKAAQYYYFQLAPFVRQQQPTLPDTIKSAISRLGGKTFLIHTPGEFAKAIGRLEAAARTAP